MPTLREAKDKVRSLSKKALDTVEDPAMSTVQKKSALDRLEPEIKTWTEEVRLLESMASRAGQFAGLDLGGLGDVQGPSFAGLAETGLRTKAAPAVRLDGDTAREMFDAARARKSYATDVATKTTDSTGIAPTGIPDFDRNPALVRREPNRIFDLIPSRTTSSPVVEYFVQTTKATAGVVAEGALKPGSDLALPLQMTRAAKIAGWVDVTDETLADFDQFYSVVTNDLSAAVIDAENAEMLSGTGVAPNYITGLLATTGILTRPFSSTTDTYALDTLDLAETDLRNGPAFAQLEAWVMHPTTFSRTRRAKNSQGAYVLNPDPTAQTAQTIWGKPVILTTQIATGVAVGAEFSDACRGFVRDGIRVTMSNSTTAADGTSNFKRNVTTILAEERVGMYVRRPAGVVKVTGLPT